MNFFWYFALSCFTATFAASRKDTRINGENGWYVPHRNGSMEWVDREEVETYRKTMRSFGDFFNPVTFTLYTNLNPDHGEIINTSSIKNIENTNFNPAYPTRFVIHGWNRYMGGALRNAWFRVGKYNVIYVKWPRANSVLYFASVWAVPGVGKHVANMIDFLVKNHKMSLNTLTVVGYSLGAHIAGFAGKYIQTGKLNTIVALDTALPLFSYDEPEKRLNQNDAYYVEAIHTNAGKLGFDKAIGNADFYPNGGEYQPGCIFDIIGFCAHLCSELYYAEAIVKNNFGTVKCDNYKNAIAKNCGDELSSVRMGAEINADIANGSYYVPVRDKSPFGILPY